MKKIATEVQALDTDQSETESIIAQVPLLPGVALRSKKLKALAQQGKLRSSDFEFSSDSDEEDPKQYEFKQLMRTDEWIDSNTRVTIRGHSFGGEQQLIDPPYALNIIDRHYLLQAFD
jgi:hypothetical protein